MPLRSEIDLGFADHGAVDLDDAMREALHFESAQVLRHQIEQERSSAANATRVDAFVSFLLMGVGIGIGFGATSSSPRPRRSRGRG